MPAPNLALQMELQQLAHKHPEWFAKDFAQHLGYNPRYIRRLLARLGLNRGTGATDKPGAANPAWRGGRSIAWGGYALLSANPKRWEHREVAANALGRPLRREEVVDHIDGLTLHNDPANLQVFASNAEHLRATLDREKHARRFSRSGRENMFLRHRQPEVLAPVNIHALRRKRGDVRLRQCILISLKFDTGHPFLSGTRRWLEQAGIDPDSRPSLERGLAAVERRYVEDLAR